MYTNVGFVTGPDAVFTALFDVLAVIPRGRIGRVFPLELKLKISVKNSLERLKLKESRR